MKPFGYFHFLNPPKTNQFQYGNAFMILHLRLMGRTNRVEKEAANSI